MQIELIETFLDLCDTRSFNRTADRMGVTQSTVSGRIKTLEKTLGHRLFIRSRAGTELTTEGLAVRAPCPQPSARLDRGASRDGRQRRGGDDADRHPARPGQPAFQRADRRFPRRDAGHRLLLRGRLFRADVFGPDLGRRGFRHPLLAALSSRPLFRDARRDRLPDGLDRDGPAGRGPARDLYPAAFLRRDSAICTPRFCPASQRRACRSGRTRRWWRFWARWAARPTCCASPRTSWSAPAPASWSPTRRRSRSRSSPESISATVTAPPTGGFSASFGHGSGRRARCSRGAGWDRG